MIGSAYLILTCLAGFYTLCLTKSAAIKAPKPSAKRVHLAPTIETASFQELTQSASAAWGHSSGFTVGIAWESNSAGIADNSGHHYLFGPSVEESVRIPRFGRSESMKNSVVRFPANRAEEEFQGRGSMPPAA